MQIPLRENMSQQDPVLQALHHAIGLGPLPFGLQGKDLPVARRVGGRERILRLPLFDRWGQALRRARGGSNQDEAETQGLRSSRFPQIQDVPPDSTGGFLAAGQRDREARIRGGRS